MGLYSLLYNLGIGFYHTGIKFASPFNSKAKLWVEGRRYWIEKLKAQLDGRPVIWIHCASLGEYEQGKPLIDALEKKWPNKQVLVSFYSPSGYEVVKRKEPNRALVYLPSDSTTNAKQFLQLVKPVLAIFVKYEFWYHYLNGLRWYKVPTILVSGVFRATQPFFKPWGNLHRDMLACFTHFFVQDKASELLLQKIGLKHVSISGDTRFDRVVAIQANQERLEVIENFKADAPVFIAGSTWLEDEKILLPFSKTLVAEGWKVIIAPHELNPGRIKNLLNTLGDQVTTYSSPEPDKWMMVIDNVGLLANAYQYAELAYVGGGFGKGIHNVLEAAACGLPIIFGPNFQKFNEARELIALGGAHSVASLQDLKLVAGVYSDEQVYARAAKVAYKYVQENKGATQKVMQWLEHLDA